MAAPHHSARHQRAASELARRWGVAQAEPIVDSLASGLNLTRDLMFQRIHEDVERYYGMDSMSMPVRGDQSEYNAKAEIDIWQLVEASDSLARKRHVDDPAEIRAWLGQLGLGASFENQAVSGRVAEYEGLEREPRQRHFARLLENVYPEARRCPLVLYPLMPHAVRIVVAVATGETVDADASRDKQTSLLPGITDCRRCRGTVLDNGELCSECGNPVWNYKWLMAAE